MSFDRWDLSIHNNPDQLKRRISASKIKPSDIKLDEIHSSAIICGSGEEPYSVTLDSCTCYDFQSRICRASICIVWLWSWVVWKTSQKWTPMQKRISKAES